MRALNGCSIVVGSSSPGERGPSSSPPTSLPARRPTRCRGRLPSPRTTSHSRRAAISCGAAAPPAPL
eukprot:6932560-Pyramimonas_sp.AAC.1